MTAGVGRAAPTAVGIFGNRDCWLLAMIAGLPNRPFVDVKPPAVNWLMLRNFVSAPGARLVTNEPNPVDGGGGVNGVPSGLAEAAAVVKPP